MIGAARQRVFRQLSNLVALVPLIFAFVTCSGANGPIDKQSSVIDTSFREVMNNPDRFDHRMVRFRARYESDGLEYSDLTHPSCPSRGISPAETSQIPRASKHAFDKAIYSGYGTIDREISATFTGVFIAHPQPGPLLRNPLYELQIADVSDIRIRILPKGAR